MTVSGSCRPSNVGVFSSLISDCLRDVASWMKSNWLKLKTEVMWCATSGGQHILPASALSVDGGMIDVSSWPWHLHENSRTANCVMVFRHSAPVVIDSPAYTARHVPDTLVLPRLDYGNGVQVGLQHCSHFVSEDRYFECDACVTGISSGVICYWK